MHVADLKIFQEVCASVSILMSKDYAGFLDYVDKRYNELANVNVFGKNHQDIQWEKMQFQKWPNLPIVGKKEATKFYDLEKELLAFAGIDGDVNLTEPSSREEAITKMNDCEKILVKLASKLGIGGGEKLDDPKRLNTEISALKKPKSLICTENMASVRQFVHRAIKKQIYEA